MRGLLFAAALLSVQNQTSRQTAGTFLQVQESKVRYWCALPKGYESSKDNFPILVFLHGAGERGDDLDRAKTHGPGKLIDQGTEYPFIVITPQCPADVTWNVQTLAKMLDDIESKYRVDKDRVYLTGLSMGGYGTWDWAAYQPNRFAAIIPICGGGSRVWGLNFGSLPIWCVHGDADPAVPISESVRMVSAVKATAHVRFTTVKKGGHDVWTAFYARRDWVDWLLQFRLQDRLDGKLKPELVEETIENSG